MSTGTSVNFFDACGSGMIDQVSKILQREPQGVHKVNGAGRTGLMCSVYSGNTPITSLLLNAGSNINTTEPKRMYTSLHLAVGRGHTSLVEMLIKRSASVNAAGNDGNTTLTLAISTNNLDIASLLLASGADKHVIHPPLAISALQLAQQKSPQIYQLLVGATASNDNEEEEEEEDDDDDEECESEEDEDEDDSADDECDEEDDECDEDESGNEGDYDKGMPLDTECIPIIANNTTGTPLTNPHLYICGQCEHPLDNVVWKCSNGQHYLCGLVSVFFMIFME